MHGMIFCELRRFVEENHGREAWEGLVAASGTPNNLYLPVRAYPDEEIVTLVSTASRLTRTPATTLLEGFGEFLTPAYFKLYGHLAPPEWGALDLIEHTEQTIHKVVRVQHPGAAPPELRCERVRDDEVVIRYGSKRNLCAVARGILRGVAKHYGEKLDIDESQCMLHGADACVISVMAGS